MAYDRRRLKSTATTKAPTTEATTMAHVATDDDEPACDFKG